MIDIVSGVRMVRRGDAAKAQNQASGKQNDFRRHLDHPYFTVCTEP
jgi:hypothetical protein